MINYGSSFIGSPIPSPSNTKQTVNPFHLYLLGPININVTTLAKIDLEYNSTVVIQGNNILNIKSIADNLYNNYVLYNSNIATYLITLQSLEK